MRQRTRCLSKAAELFPRTFWSCGASSRHSGRQTAAVEQRLEVRTWFWPSPRATSGRRIAISSRLQTNRPQVLVVGRAVRTRSLRSCVDGRTRLGRLPFGSPPRGPGARRPRISSGPLAPPLRSGSTSRPASGRETRNAAGRVMLLDVERTRRRTVPTLSSECRKSHWCLRERHHASIMEFENCSSVKASTRRSTPVVISASTWAFTFSTPESANTTGVVSEEATRRLASSSTTTLFPRTGAQRPALAFLRESQLLRTAGLLHVARVGVEGQPCRCVLELAQPSVVRRVDPAELVSIAQGARGGARLLLDPSLERRAVDTRGSF